MLSFCLRFVNYALFLVIGGLLFSGSKSTRGGLVANDFFRATMGTSFLLSAWSGSCLRSGPFSPPKHNPWVPDSPSSASLLLLIAAYNFLVLTAAFNGPKNMSNEDMLTPVSRAFFNWTILWTTTLLFFVVYAATYEGTRTNRYVFGLLGSLNVLAEIYARLPMSLPDQALPKARAVKPSCLSAGIFFSAIFEVHSTRALK